MWNIPTKEELDRLPRLYETEQTPIEDKLVRLHFFLGAFDWYVVEYDGEDLFWGYAILGDPEMAEWGYISFSELRKLKVRPGFEVDRDLYWEPKKVKEVDKIRVRA